MSEKDSNTEQDFPEIPPMPFDNELDMLKRMLEEAPNPEVEANLRLKIKILQEE
jgi:hypothetical protein